MKKSLILNIIQCISITSKSEEPSPLQRTESKAERKERKKEKKERKEQKRRESISSKMEENSRDKFNILY